MNHVEFTTALVRLSRHRIGIAEAATLFVTAEGATAQQVARATGITPGLATARLRVLRGKCLVDMQERHDGNLYRPSSRGQAIIRDAFKSKSNPSPADQ